MPSSPLSAVECRLKRQLGEGACSLNIRKVQLLFLFFKIEIHVNKSPDVFFLDPELCVLHLGEYSARSLWGASASPVRPGPGWVMQEELRSVNSTLGPPPLLQPKNFNFIYFIFYTLSFLINFHWNKGFLS